MKGHVKGQRVIVTLVGVVLVLLGVCGGTAYAYSQYQQQRADQIHALAHTYVGVPGQPDMKVQIFATPGEPSIGAVDPFTRVGVHCVVTINADAYALVMIDPSSSYFADKLMYVRLKDVGHRDGAPGCP